MPGPSRKTPLAVALALASALTVLVTSTACTRAAKPDSPAPTDAPAEHAHADEHAHPREKKGPLDVPGMDFSQLPPAAQAELAAVFTDEFCYCGCPHTLGACLTEHTECRHAKRMARLAAEVASAGHSSNEIIVLLSRYYLSFRERAEIPVDPKLCQGPADAKVTVVEFSDFECPYCAMAVPQLEAFAAANAEQVRLCHVPFPLPGHPNALPAAQAALLARDRGHFKAMHHALFEQQAQLSQPKILELAEKVGVSRAEVTKAWESGAYRDEIDRARELGRRLGVNGTPTVFVNGRRYELGYSPDPLRHTLEDELEWQANGGWAKD